MKRYNTPALVDLQQKYKIYQDKHPKSKARKTLSKYYLVETKQILNHKIIQSLNAKGNNQKQYQISIANHLNHQDMNKTHRIQQSMQTANSLNSPIQQAKNILNRCSFLSKLGNHQQAIQVAKSALELLKQNPTNKLNNYTQLSQLVVMSFYNIATELSFLHRQQQAFKIYRKGYQISIKNLGLRHRLTNLIRSIIQKNRQQQMVMSKRIQTQTTQNKYNLTKNIFSQKKLIKLNGFKRNKTINPEIILNQNTQIMKSPIKNNNKSSVKDNKINKSPIKDNHNKQINQKNCLPKLDKNYNNKDKYKKKTYTQGNQFTKSFNSKSLQHKLQQKSIKKQSQNRMSRIALIGTENKEAQKNQEQIKIQQYDKKQQGCIIM